MRKLFFSLLLLLTLGGCAAQQADTNGYRCITMQEAAEWMTRESGYTNVVEFGGILDWQGEIVTESP